MFQLFDKALAMDEYFIPLRHINSVFDTPEALEIMRRGFGAIEGRDIAIEQGLSIDIFKNEAKCFNTRLLRMCKMPDAGGL